MNIQLDPKDLRDVEALAQESGKQVGEMLRELVHEAIAERKQNGAHFSDDGETIAAKQRQALEELIEELDALPPEGFPEPKGRPVSENVDECLYGWKK